LAWHSKFSGFCVGGGLAKSNASGIGIGIGPIIAVGLEWGIFLGDIKDGIMDVVGLGWMICV
jgi:hypothetical protein